MKSKDGHVTMPTEDHHGNTSVKVHGPFLICMAIKCCHGNKRMINHRKIQYQLINQTYQIM